jgi:hypothetical protein
MAAEEEYSDVDFEQELLEELGEGGTNPDHQPSPYAHRNGHEDHSSEPASALHDGGGICTGNDAHDDATSYRALPPKRRKLASDGEPQVPQLGEVGAEAGNPGLTPPLAQLTEELLLRVMCFLSPEDLATLGRVSHLFHSAANDASLWRRLYFARCGWGPGRPGAAQPVQVCGNR